MPSGRLGAADLAANTDTTVYTVPAGTLTVCNLTVCNRTSTPVTVRVAIAAAAAPTGAEFIEYETNLAGNGVLERTGLVLDAGKRLVVRSSAASVNAVAMGMEEAA